MDRWKSRGGKGQRREEERRSEKRKSQKKEDAGAGKGRKVAWFVVPEGRKVSSLKRRVQSHLGRREMTNCTPLWREAHLQVKKLKAPHVRSTFGSCDVEKGHAVVVAWSTLRSQNVQSTPHSVHFWQLRCSKSLRCCGAKHVSKSKCTKHLSLGALLEVEMSKKSTPLWREAQCTKHTGFRALFEVQMSRKWKPLWCEAHFQVKMCKAHHVQCTFGS